ncbi:MAG TPA: thioredoxin domain-containing protein [Anaeromyxobacteraceae bacterium]|nr:thioredoxin domain-containing protein [Anaeromyxobacteraceae bacterium]
MLGAVFNLPGAAPFPADLQKRLAEAYLEKGPEYTHRTRHLAGDRPRFTNRLILETSPYLLQHAHNPVSWWPWCEEAFAEARQTGRPLFLSVGYSTCHWCHVMEVETFEDEEIASYLNERFVAIKVDREERPDVDAVYMSAVQALTGSGGWPMSVFLRDNGEPFFAGTYFPPRDGDRGALRGFLSILRTMTGVWEEDQARVRSTSDALARAVRVALSGNGAEAAREIPGSEAIEKAVRFFDREFDSVNGGAMSEPKFPSNLPVRLLLRYHRRSQDPAALHMSAFTLERMAAGGLMDQIGGGFHRYSTDGRWLVPHFEKMLYDNALLSIAYLECWQVTGRREFSRVARQTLDYALREMASAGGAFFSATDADSEGEEGRFFLWQEQEVRELLGKDADLFINYYGLTPEGNFEGRNILHVKEPDEDTWEALRDARTTLYLARQKRPRPFRDEKVLAGWNGLMISALAMGGRILAEPLYVEAAARAADFLLENMRPGGRLVRVYKNGLTGPPAFLQDHAFLAQGFIDLHEATFEPHWLETAIALADATEQHFSDPRGGWFSSGADQERLIAREKPTHDGAEPSGASVALLNVLRIGAFTGDPRWHRIAEAALRWHAPTLAEQPLVLADMLLALDAYLDAPREVVLVWPEGQDAPESFLEVLRKTFLPNRALTGAQEGTALSRLSLLAPVAEGRVAVSGKPTAYVCERGACRLPAISPEKLSDQLRPVRPYRTAPNAS